MLFANLTFLPGGPDLLLARDGIPPFIIGAFPQFQRHARIPVLSKIPMYIPKFESIINKVYIEPGRVISLTNYFDVPKSDADVCLVYDGTTCGLNNSLWTPNVGLPTPASAIRVLDFNYYSANLDLGDMYLNYPLHPSLRLYSGVDHTPFKEGLGVNKPSVLWYCWNWIWMGENLLLF
jgi:hypothetical protein